MHGNPVFSGGILHINYIMNSTNKNIVPQGFQAKRDSEFIYIVIHDERYINACHG